ncbi:hypothetical protein ACFOEY_20135 [Paracandidimonas soli]|uniref:hypothetical protein n=1 Tax=Paracandidimonas soli TaxID=1917182 RepID=UPI0036175FD9
MKTEGDYYRQLLQLLPLGPAWDSDLNPVFMVCFVRLPGSLPVLMLVLMTCWVRWCRRCVRELLPDWERVMGLPDRCTAVQPQFWQRRAEVVRRFGAVGEQRPAYFIQIAALMGYQGRGSSSTGRRALGAPGSALLAGGLGGSNSSGHCSLACGRQGVCAGGLRCGVIALG